MVRGGKWIGGEAATEKFGGGGDLPEIWGMQRRDWTIEEETEDATAEEFFGQNR